MIKFISSEEHAKLTGDIDYWNCQALEQKRWHDFYENKARLLLKENELLKQKIEELDKEKVTFINLGEFKSLTKAKKLAEEVRKVINNEHHCNTNCFSKHVLPAIQNDYNKFEYNSILLQNKFFEHWNNKLFNEYDFAKSIALVNGKISVRF